MKKVIISLLCASIAVSAITPSLYGITAIQQGRQAVENKMQQAKQKLRSFQKDMSELSNCALHGACSPEEQAVLRKKLAIGAAAIGTTIAALTAAITTAVVLSRRGKTPIVSPEGTPETVEEISAEAVPFEQQPPQKQAVIEKAFEVLRRAVLRSDEQEVKNILAQLRQYKYPISAEPSQNFVTPQGDINLLTYATIMLDQPVAEALIAGGITPIINEKAIKEATNSGLINPKDATYIEIRKLIEKAKKR